MKLLETTATTAVALTALLGTAVAPARGFSITPNNNGSALLQSLLGDTTGLSNFSVNPIRNANAFGIFENDPFELGSGIVLSTGNVTEIPGENTEDGRNLDYATDLSTDFGIEGDTDDSISLDISFDADSTADKVFFQYVFGSEEFLEFGGSEFNDAFELLLNGTNLAKLSDGQDATIANLIPNRSGTYHPDFINNPAGPDTLTKLDGYTKTLAFEGLLNKNSRNTLTINIKDTADGLMDSAVFLKGGSLGTAPPAETVPEPSAVLGLVGAGAIGFLKGRRNQKKQKF